MLGMLGMRNSRSGAMHIHACRYASTTRSTVVYMTVQVSCSHNSHYQYLQILSLVPLVESLNNCYLPHFFPLYQILRIFHRFKWQIQKAKLSHPSLAPHLCTAIPTDSTVRCKASSLSIILISIEQQVSG